MKAPLYAVSVLLLIAGIAVELVILNEILSMNAWHRPLLWQLFWLHLLAAMLMAFGGIRLLPQQYQNDNSGGMVYLFSMAFFIPFIGALVIVLSLLPGLWMVRQPTVQVWEERYIPELALRSLHIHTDIMFMRDGILSSLINMQDPEYRQEAISSCRYLGRREAVPILQTAMTDPAEEVRLQAFSMLAKYERQLEEQVHELEIKAEQKPQDDRTQEMLARLYWEYIYLDLSRSTLTEFFMQKAVMHLKKALALAPAPGRWLMLARIYTKLGRFNEAQEAINEASAHGFDGDYVAPYQAELSFQMRQFKNVRADLDLLSDQARQNPKLAPVVAFWS